MQKISATKHNNIGLFKYVGSTVRIDSEPPVNDAIVEEERCVPLGGFAEVVWSLQKLVDEQVDAFRLDRPEHHRCLCVEVALYQSALAPESISICEERQAEGPSHSMYRRNNFIELCYSCREREGGG